MNDVLVHPAYVNIISQMSPLEAKILQLIMNTPDKSLPIIDLISSRRDSSGEKSYVILQTNITSLDIASIESISLSFENLSRNNLISISEEKNLSGYKAIYESKQYQHFLIMQKSKLPPMYPTIKIKEKNCSLSILGKYFCEICVS